MVLTPSLRKKIFVMLKSMRREIKKVMIKMKRKKKFLAEEFQGDTGDDVGGSV